MPTHRTGKVWSASVGWIAKRPTEKRDYTDFENDGWALLISYWRWFPDALCDLLRSDAADYSNEEILQRVIMRAFARYQNVDVTGARGLTKTSTKFKQKMVGAILWPATKSSYYGPSYKQLAAIGSKTFRQIEHDYPALAKHFTVEHESDDSFEISTAKGSSFAISAFRGDNIHDVTAEEYAQEELPAFDYSEYKRVVLPAIRLLHMIGGEVDPTFIPYQKHSITSAGRKQNHAYQTRCRNRAAMSRGESAFVIDVPWQIVVLSLMRPYEWAENLKSELTPEEWLREMEARYTGADENPVVRDEVLTESRNLMVMEDRHCGDPNVFYIVGYDVSYEDGSRNAKCAAVVTKCSLQKSFMKRDKFLKSVVRVEDWPPPPDVSMQAKRLKDLWYRFCMEGGAPTYIAIDGWQYGKAVVEQLMKDLGDGLPPLCIYNHAAYTEMELDGALPVVYPVKAGGAGATDSDWEMIRYAQIQFDNRNVRLLTVNLNEGVETYKKYHLIKDNYADAAIAVPYRKTTELAGQIQNLKLVPSGAGMSEKRISKFIQRDSWSALKYSLRFAQVLEKKYYLEMHRKESGWASEMQRFKSDSMPKSIHGGARGISRMRGRRF